MNIKESPGADNYSMEEIEQFLVTIMEFHEDPIKIRIASWCRNYGIHTNKAEDFYAEAILRLLEPDKYPWPRSDKEPVGFIYYKCKQVVLDYCKTIKKGKEASIEYLDRYGTIATTPNPEKAMIQSEKIDKFFENCKTDQDRDIADKFYKLQMTKPEISEALGLPLKKIESRLRTIQNNK